MSDELENGPARIAAAARSWVSPEAIERFVAYMPQDGTSESEVDSAVAAADRASAAAYGEEAAAADVVVVANDGIHIRLTKKGTTEARRAWLKALAAALPGGTVERPRTNRGPNAVLERLLAVETVTSFAGAREAAAHSLAIKARRVFSLPGATAYVSSSEAAFALPDGPEADRVLGLLQTSAPNVLLVAQDDHVAELSWLMQDELTARLVDSEGWQSHLDVARSLLREAAADLDVGFVRTCPGLGGWSTIHTYPPVPPAGTLTSAFFNSRRLWPVRVADAYGLQLLTGKHLNRANDLSTWKVTPVEDRYLVEARDPEAWFAGTPDPEILAAARADFGDIIVTQQELEAAQEADYEDRLKPKPQPA